MYDIAIAGGGVIGSSIAYHLTKSGRAGRVAVIEPDPSYEFASTPRSAGGIRRLFSLPENIQMSAFSPHDSPHIQIAPKVSAKTGSSASIVANRSTSGSRRNSGMVGMSS
jgi:glycine/D-amino acid oxidase-like deaminating enzyme